MQMWLNVNRRGIWLGDRLNSFVLFFSFSVSLKFSQNKFFKNQARAAELVTSESVTILINLYITVFVYAVLADFRGPHSFSVFFNLC